VLPQPPKNTASGARRQPTNPAIFKPDLLLWALFPIFNINWHHFAAHLPGEK
jgi:hypothetical protein